MKTLKFFARSDLLFLSIHSMIDMTVKVLIIPFVYAIQKAHIVFTCETIPFFNLFAFVMEPEKSERPHFYGNFILAGRSYYSVSVIKYKIICKDKVIMKVRVLTLPGSHHKRK